MNTITGHHRTPSLHSLSLVLLLAAALLIPKTGPALARPLALADTHYVSPIGADSPNNCTSSAAPCQTIKYAISQAASDDTLKVATGLYTSTELNEVVLIDKNLVLQGGWDEGFGTQAGTSTLDGAGARRGFTVIAGITASIDHFTVEDGHSPGEGGGIWNAGTLTLYASLIRRNSSPTGGGIYNSGTLIINQTTIANNVAGLSGGSGYGGGGIENNTGTLTINNSTLSGNSVLGGYMGSAIDNYGSLTLNNTTLSGNTSADAIYQAGGTLNIFSSTIANNSAGGIWVYGGSSHMQNSILAKNTAGTVAYDCFGTLTSGGYNILGNNNGCAFTPEPGDQVGTPVTPIDPRLRNLANNGGPTRTRALADNSPALNAGSPATPGSADPTACPATDQRGEARGDPVEDLCDIGAYEGSVPLVLSVTRINANPTSKQNVYFKVTFTSPVTNVDTVEPFSDFKLTLTGGISNAKVAEVTGSGAKYTVRVYTGKGNGTLRLDVKDLDTILSASTSVPLGGPGVGNAAFNSGQVYTLSRIPKTVWPAGLIWDNTPTFKWTRIPGATKYSIQLMQGTSLVFNKTLDSGACSATGCSITPATPLASDSYQWRVRAMTGGIWKAYSPYRSFTINKPKAGFWPGDTAGFYVSPDRASVLSFTILVDITKCGLHNYPIVQSLPVPVIDHTFGFSGNFHASGVFDSATSAHGTADLYQYAIPDCGIFNLAEPVSWHALWYSDSQPGMIGWDLQQAPSIVIVQESQPVIPAWILEPSK